MASQEAGLHVGVVGVGRIGALHARTLSGLDNVSTVTVTDSDLARAETLASSLGIELARSVEELIENLDALVVATPTPSHASLIGLAASASLPTFCEKP